MKKLLKANFIVACVFVGSTLMALLLTAMYMEEPYGTAAEAFYFHTSNAFTVLMLAALLTNVVLITVSYFVGRKRL